MQRVIMKSKIHGATETQAVVDFEQSCQLRVITYSICEQAAVA
jgi:aspartate 1-decarboxylase